MRDSVPSARYSPVCNVLRLWKIWLIPNYRIYRLYDANANKILKDKAARIIFSQCYRSTDELTAPNLFCGNITGTLKGTQNILAGNHTSSIISV